MNYRWMLGALLLVPSAAAAQSFYLQSATLTRDGEGVGEVSGLTVEVVRWFDATAVRVRHADEAVTLEADVDLTDEHDYLQAGVGQDVRLRGTGAWKVTMLRGTWAPVLRGSADEVRVALPPALPVSWGRVVHGTSPAPAAPAGGPWAYDSGIDDEAPTGPPSPATTNEEPPEESAIVPEGEVIPHCPELTIHAGPRTDDPGWLVPSTVYDVRKVGERGGWYEVRVRHDGFLLEGFVEQTATHCEEVLGGLGMSGTGMGCGDGIANGRAVRLAPGTQLFVTADAAEPFATLRRENTGLEVVDGMVAQGCHSDGTTRVCERIPPEPTGIVRWIVEPEGTDGRMLLSGFVHISAEDLPDQDPNSPSAGGGFGLCSPHFDDWPRPASPAPRP